jgi:hypothetical protein
MTTTLKFMPGRRECVLHEATSVANPHIDAACRTKLACDLRGDIGKLFSNGQFGWRHVTSYGNL